MSEDKPLYKKLPENKVCTVSVEPATNYAEDVNERLCYAYPIEVFFRSKGGEISLNKPPVGRYTAAYMLGTLARDIQNLGDELIQEISEQSIPKTGNLDEKKERLLEILSEQTWDFVQVSSPDFEGRGSVRDLLASIILFGAEYLATDKIIRERDSEKNIDKIDIPEESKQSQTPFSDVCNRLKAAIKKKWEEDVRNGIKRPADYFYRVNVKDVLGEDSTREEKQE